MSIIENPGSKIFVKSGSDISQLCEPPCTYTSQKDWNVKGEFMDRLTLFLNMSGVYKGSIINGVYGDSEGTLGECLTERRFLRSKILLVTNHIDAGDHVFETTDPTVILALMELSPEYIAHFNHLQMRKPESERHFSNGIRIVTNSTSRFLNKTIYFTRRSYV